MVSITEMGRKVVIFTLIVSILDTVLLDIFIGTGVPVPSQLVFVPSGFLSWEENMMNTLRTIYVPNTMVFLLFVAIIYTLITIANFLIGLLAGWVVFGMNAYSLLSVYPFTAPLAPAVLAFCAAMEALSMVYIVSLVLQMFSPL